MLNYSTEQVPNLVPLEKIVTRQSLEETFLLRLVTNTSLSYRVLPKSESFVQRHWMQLAPHFKKKTPVKYRSLMDKILGETFKKFQIPIVKFNHGKGKNLRGLYPEEIIRTLDSNLLCSLYKKISNSN